MNSIYDKNTHLETTPTDKNISIVMQGLPSPETKKYLQSLRRIFPNSEIILSTWEGTDVSFSKNLVDQIVFSKDPGGIASGFYQESIFINNLNRQIVSTVAGIKAASRPYVMKIRTDFTLSNDKLLSFWKEYPSRDHQYSIFKHRIIVPSVFSRFFSDERNIPMPFHPSDLFGFGLKEDILLFYGSAPLATKEELADWKYKYPQLIPYRCNRWRYAPEQVFFLYAAKSKFPNIQFDDWTDVNQDNIQLSKKLLVDNFIFLNPGQFGLISKKQQIALDASDRKLINGLISNETFDCLYCKRFNEKRFNETPTPTKRTAAERLIVHKARFQKQLRSFIRNFNLFSEPFVILYYWIMSRFER